MIELGKKYQTRDGRAVRILCVDLKGPFSVAGAIAERDGTEYPTMWTSTGEWRGVGNDGYALIPVPTKHVQWALMDTHFGQVKGYRYDTKAEADAECRPEQNEIVVCLTWEN